MSPRVSVIMPAYNAGSFIDKAIESLLSQTFDDLEIIVADDGSTDGTPDIASKYPKVTVLRQDHKGVAAARNLGVRNAKGEFIAFLDADDLWAPDKLEKQITYMDGHPECIFCQTGYGNFTDIAEEELTEGQKELLETEAQFYMAAGLVRKKAFDIYGYFDESFAYAEDSEWMWRIRLHNISSMYKIEEKLYLRRVHTDNITLTHSDMKQQDMLPIIAKAIQKLRKAGLR